MLSLAPVTSLAEAGPRATEFTLPNGLMVVVVPDNGAPVVTHMIGFRVGGADEPPGASGIAHFLEHLMFKATDKIATGEFSKIISRLGGQDNAFTAQDVTAYFQRISKDRLPKIMEMEADRMVNLRLDEKEVLTERDVILEERRSRVENNPSSILDEQLSAALYLSHPYRIPVIGWEHEIAKLSRDDALNFYKRFYAPNNAILVVTGDVSPEEVRKLAEGTYGKIPRNAEMLRAERPSEPPHRAQRRVELKDPRAGRRTWHRQYIAPAYTKAAPGEAEAIDLLLKILASGPTSRIYRKLVVEEKIVSSAGGWYSGTARDLGKIAFFAVPNDGVEFEKIEQLIDGVIADVAAKGVTEAELERAKKSYLAEYVYGSDNQASLARRYGWALTVGATIKDIEEWPDRLSKVTAAQVQDAVRHLDIRASVTGTLLPVAPDPVPGSRS
jgi:zinc protease